MRRWQSALCYIMVLVLPNNATNAHKANMYDKLMFDQTSTNKVNNKSNAVYKLILDHAKKVNSPLRTHVTSDIILNSDESNTSQDSIELQAESKNIIHKSKDYVEKPSAYALADDVIDLSASSSSSLDQMLYPNELSRLESSEIQADSYPEMPDSTHPVRHAGLPRGLAAHPLPLEGSDHELKLNVTWEPNIGSPVSDYSLEVRSVTDTIDCKTPMCYEYNIPGKSLWWVIPPYPSPVADSCAVRPGCAYTVRLIAHPWDGHTAANIHVQLDECEVGVCSCAHAPRLPTPRVSARTVSVQGGLFVNITWDLPPPDSPYRLPPGLRKQYYFVSIGKQMVSDAHPSPWFAHSISRRVEVDTQVSEPDAPRWILIPTTERGFERGDKRTRHLTLDVKLLARVNLVDERGCIGPAGNATAYDPMEGNKSSIATYILWAVFGGACVLAAGAIFAASARLIKRTLQALRPTPSAALEPLRHRPLWLPISIATKKEALH